MLLPSLTFFAGIKESLVKFNDQSLVLSQTIVNPSWLSTTGRFVCVASEQIDGFVTCYDFQGQWISQIQVPSPTHMAISSSLNLIGIASYSSSDIRVYQLDIITGRFGSKVFEEKYWGRGPNSDRQEAPHPHQFVFHQDKFYVPDLGLDVIHVYKTAGFQKLDSIVMPRGCGPRHMAFLNDDILCVCELSNSIALVRENQVIGLAAVADEWFPSKSGAAEILIYKNDIYVSQRDTQGGAYGFLAHFKVDGNVPKRQKMYQLPGRIPRFFTEKEGRLYVLMSDQSKMSIYNINSDGSLVGIGYQEIGFGGQALVFV